MDRPIETPVFSWWAATYFDKKGLIRIMVQNTAVVYTDQQISQVPKYNT